MSDYKSTLNLPKTSFSMKANLVQREPETLKRWEEAKIYEDMVKSSGSKGTYVLHDGPPYANGHIHMGHALNKILKDIIIKSRNMQGYAANYVPGWDCHGLPIELKVEQTLGEKKKTLPASVVRKCCRDYAKKWIDTQRKEFKRLGVLGAWDAPYMSMTPSYEAATSHELANFVANGSVIRSKKPIYWCCSCHTALAEAEVEYNDHTSPSVYVRFPLPDEKLKEIFPQANTSKTSIIIWTTTPWTLPDNMAVCLHPDITYALVQVEDKQYILAEELVETCAPLFKWQDWNILATVSGTKLEGLKARHPFYDRESLVILGSHVTLDAGTGCVHTAPGHGREDYEVGLKYGLPIESPLDESGRFLPSVPLFAGLNVFESNPVVIETLRKFDVLMAEEKITHSYPHCWRCKKPVIFHATTQWFISMEKNNLRKKALKAIANDVQWIPTWGEERIHNMIEFRPDWCISRQRQWGVPITALLCEDCGNAWNDPKWMHEIADRFAKHPTGCDYWYEADLSEIVPEGLKCPHCGGSHWKRETDILDVWFDSGTSFSAVAEQRPELSFPTDMYLEGSDQHRGWFHSSLLAAIGTRGIPPYKAVLTHGYVLDGEGRKMSKSVGNVIAPQELTDKYGADIVRLWVSSVEYREDIRISEQIISRVVDAYRRIRNTCRFLLGNLYDISLDDLVKTENLLPLDRYILNVAENTHSLIQESYTACEFHKIFHALHNFCVTDLSALYLDIVKDRLYASRASGIERRSAQTAIFHILQMLLRDMAPILSFTADEIFRAIPDQLKDSCKSVFSLQPISCNNWNLDGETAKKWENLLKVRAAVVKAIEPLRQNGVVGHALDTRVTLYMDDALSSDILSLKTDLRADFIVSQLVCKQLTEAPADAVKSEDCEGLAIKVERAQGDKCERCWIYSSELGSNPEHPTLCPRCSTVLANE